MDSIQRMKHYTVNCRPQLKYSIKNLSKLTPVTQCFNTTLTTSSKKTVCKGSVSYLIDCIQSSLSSAVCAYILYTVCLPTDQQHHTHQLGQYYRRLY